MATATASYSSTSTTSEASLMDGTPSSNGYVARYQLESQTIFGTVMEFHPEWIEGQPVEYGRAYSIHSGGMASFRNLLVQHRFGVYAVTVFADQGDGIPALMDLNPGDLISVVATEFTSSSRRFVNTYRVWSVLDPVESLEVQQQVSLLTRQCLLTGASPRELIFPLVRDLVLHGSLPWRLCLNGWSKYLP